MLPDVDGRTATARRYRDLYASLAEEMGGEAALGEADRALIRLAAGLMVESEALQSEIVRQRPVNHEQLVRVTNSLTRTLSKLHAKARPTPTLPLRDRLRGAA